MVKNILLFTLLLFACTAASAQQEGKKFHAYIVNNEYSVYLKINFHEQDVDVPGQPLYGKLPGYLGKKNNSFCWPITSAKLKNDKLAEIQLINGKSATLALINDYGSEDLTATLTCKNDSTYVLKHVSGSAIKVPNNGKWQKLPKTIVFKTAKP